LAKDNRVNSLEDFVIKVGHDPIDVKAIEDNIKNKNADIETLRKHLKLPSIEDPQTEEIAESEQHKEEMIKLIIEKNVQIKIMEEKIEKLLKEKEEYSQIAISPITTISIIVSRTAGESTSTTT